MSHQHFVHVAKEAYAQREAGAQLLQPELQRSDTSTHLARIFDRHAGLLVDFVQEEIGQRGLRSLDLRREHRFFANETVEQKRGIGEERRDGVEPAEGEQGVVEAPPQGGRPDQRRFRRKRHRHEGPEPLRGGGDGAVLPCRSTPHDGT